MSLDVSLCWIRRKRKKNDFKIQDHKWLYVPLHKQNIVAHLVTFLCSFLSPFIFDVHALILVSFNSFSPPQKGGTIWADSKVNIDIDSLSLSDKYKKHQQPSMNQLQQQSKCCQP